MELLKIPFFVRYTLAQGCVHCVCAVPGKPRRTTLRAGTRSLRNSFKQMVKESLAISLTELTIRRSAIVRLFLSAEEERVR